LGVGLVCNSVRILLAGLSIIMKIEGEVNRQSISLRFIGELKGRRLILQLLPSIFLFAYKSVQVDIGIIRIGPVKVLPATSTNLNRQTARVADLAGVHVFT